MAETNEPRKRRRLRRLTSFSLRTALIAITVLAVWLGLHMNSVRKQRAAIEAVQRHGGEFAYDYKVTDDLLYAVMAPKREDLLMVALSGGDTVGQRASAGTVSDRRPEVVVGRYFNDSALT